MSSYNDQYYDDNFKLLRKKAPTAMSYVLSCANIECTSNYTINTTSWYEDKDDSWLLHLSCKRCNAKWCICRSCKMFKVIMKSNRQICVHRYSFHTEKSNMKRKLKQEMKQNKKAKLSQETDNENGTFVLFRGCIFIKRQLTYIFLYIFDMCTSMNWENNG